VPEGNAVRLAVLGGVKVFMGGEPVPLRSRKAHALLAYLALSGKVCLQREFLAGLLWSDVETAKARSSLRQTVTELRATFADTDVLIIGRSEITLRQTELSTDLHDVLRALERGEVPDVMLSRTSIVDSLLYGFEDLGEGYSEWVQELRIATERRMQQLLAAGYGNDTADYATRKRMAESALLLDPMQEDACRALMKLAAEAGDLGTALRAYERLYTTLDEEMGMEPSSRTQDLAVRIKQGEFEPPPPPPQQQRAGPRAPARPQPAAGIPRLAVMPMRLLGPDRAPDHLPEMLLDDIVGKLAGLREPAVISSASTRAFAADQPHAEALRDRLRADYALYGRIGRMGDTYRLSTELVELRGESVVWADTFSMPEPELFLTQSLIAGQIANRLVPSLNGTELRLTASYQPRDLTAYHLTLRARELMFEMDRSAFDEAGELLDLALEKDARFTPAYVSYADWHSLRVNQAWSADPAAEWQALEAKARAAMQLNGLNAPAMAMLAHNLVILARGQAEAQRLFDAAVDSAPNDASTLMWTVPALAFRRSGRAAVDRAQQAISLSPSDPFLFRYEHFLSIAHYFAGDLEAAAEAGLASMRRNPHYTSNLRLTGAALAEIGRMDEARAIARLVREEEPGFTLGGFVRRASYMHPEDAQRIGQQLLRLGLPE
jgi:DNA-binding SARP family transcriptional activator/tetratricopeptide (TPR) repeat protein